MELNSLLIMTMTDRQSDRRVCCWWRGCNGAERARTGKIRRRENVNREKGTVIARRRNRNNEERMTSPALVPVVSPDGRGWRIGSDKTPVSIQKV